MNTLHQPGVREISKFPKRMQFLILIWLYRSAITGLTDLGISWLVKLDLIAHCFERAAFRCSRLICHNSVIPAIHPDHCSPETLGVDVERRLFCPVIVKLVTSVRVPVVYPSQRITPCMTFVIQALIHVLLIQWLCGRKPRMLYGHRHLQSVEYFRRWYVQRMLPYGTGISYYAFI